jgi:hypothetical protein
MGLAEEASTGFDQGSSERVRELTDDKIQLLVSALNGKLDQLQATFPSTSSENSKPPFRSNDLKLIRRQMKHRFTAFFIASEHISTKSDCMDSYRVKQCPSRV